MDPVPRRSPAECEALRRQYGVPEGVFTMGILARLEPYKGHQHILEAAQMLKEADFLSCFILCSLLPERAGRLLRYCGRRSRR